MDWGNKKKESTDSTVSRILETLGSVRSFSFSSEDDEEEEEEVIKPQVFLKFMTQSIQ